MIVPFGLIWHTPPENQGQHVETTFAWHDGAVYRRVLDRSDGSEEYHSAEWKDVRTAYPFEEFDPWNGRRDWMDTADWRVCEGRAEE